jgi:bromodomain and WD repeat domain-containing protein 1/3
MVKRQSRIAYFFLDPVDVGQYPEYLEHVPLMSYITLILNRYECILI